MIDATVYTDAQAITTSDTVDHASNLNPANAIYVGGAGNIVVVLCDGRTRTFNGATAGSIIPIRHKRVNATSTTATNLVALY